MAGAVTEAVDAFLLAEAAAATAQERTNLRFHLSMIAAARLLGSRVWNPAQLRAIVSAKTPITDADLPACLAVPRNSFAQRSAKTCDGLDKIAKEPEFVDFLLERALAPVEGVA